MAAFDRWALVTGCNGGIGSATCDALAEKGWMVAGIDVVGAKGPNIHHFIKGDIASSKIQKTVESYVVKKGSPGCIIFCSGQYDRTPFLDYSTEKADEVISNNFFGVLHLTRKLLPHLTNAETGRVIVVTSQAGSTGGADTVYASAKAACNTLVKSLAREYASRGLQFIAVSPGPVTSQMSEAAMSDERKAYYLSQIPSGRFVTCEEVSELITFLVSSNQSSINGTTIDIDGGLVRR